MCARTAHPDLIARASAGSQTRWIPSGSPERCSRIRCCPRRSSAPGRSRARTSSASCSPCGTTGAGRSLPAASTSSTRRSTCSASFRWSSQSSCPTPRPSSRGSRRSHGVTARRRYDAPTKLRLQLLDGYRAQIKALDLEEKQVVAQLDALVGRSGSTLGDLSGLSTRSVAELLVEVGDPRRFTEGGFARFNGSAPLPASTAEGPGEPVRHRYNPGGNRRVNAILHRMAVTQLRCEPRAQRIYAGARANGHTKKEARRILKRHLSDVIYRRMIRDLAAAERASLSVPLLAA